MSNQTWKVYRNREFTGIIESNFTYATRHWAVVARANHAHYELRAMGNYPSWSSRKTYDDLITKAKALANNVLRFAPRG